MGTRRRRVSAHRAEPHDIGGLAEIDEELTLALILDRRCQARPVRAPLKAAPNRAAIPNRTLSTCISDQTLYTAGCWPVGLRFGPISRTSTLRAEDGNRQ